jgi:hypothetical protein
MEVHQGALRLIINNCRVSLEGLQQRRPRTN